MYEMLSALKHFMQDEKLTDRQKMLTPVKKNAPAGLRENRAVAYTEYRVRKWLLFCRQ